MNYVWLLDSVLKMNGWHYEEGNEYECVYSMCFDIGEGCTAYIDLCAKHDDIYLNNDFGIYSVSVKSHDNPYFNDSTNYENLLIMETTIEYAEENLLKLGLPFCKNYVFHGKNKYRKHQMNNTNRKRYTCDDIVDSVTKEQEETLCVEEYFQ